MTIPDPSTSVPQTPQPPSIEPSLEPEPPAAEQLSWWQVWFKALTHPTTASYQAIINNPSASLKRGLLWFFTTSWIVYFYFEGGKNMLISLMYAPFTFTYYELGGFLLLAIIALVLAAITTLMFVISTAITNIMARLLRGQGSFHQLIYAISAFTAPLMLIIAGIVWNFYINRVGSLKFFAILLMVLFGLYALLLHVVSIRAVHKLGGGRALTAVFAPPVLAFVAFYFLVWRSGLLDALSKALSNSIFSID